MSEMSNSAGEASKSSDSVKSPKHENDNLSEKLLLKDDVEKEVVDKIEIIENNNVDVLKEMEKDSENKVTGSELKRTNSVKARANLFQELEKKQKDIEKTVLQKPKRGRNQLFFIKLFCLINFCEFVCTY